MLAADVRVGDSVVIVATGEFFAFVDGWRGRVAGWNNGAVEVRCVRPDGEKVFFVPPANLALSVGA